MAETQQTNPLSGIELQGSAAEFAAWCEAEFENRRNSGEAFDEAAYREAMILTLQRLQALSEEGAA